MLAGQADPAEPRAERAGFHIVRSDQTSLTSATLWRNHQRKVRDFHYAHLSKCCGAAEVGLKNKTAEDEDPTFTWLVVWRVSLQRSWAPVLRAACPLAAEGLQAPGTHPSASHSQKATLCRCCGAASRTKCAKQGQSRDSFPKHTPDSSYMLT